MRLNQAGAAALEQLTRAAGRSSDRRAMLLAYGMNGRDLPVPHGAPVRLRVERQISYKSMKYLHRIVATDRFDDGGLKGENGWAWYTGI